MFAVFKHELNSYFSGLQAYVFGGFLLFFAGIYMMVYNIANGMACFEYIPGSMSFIFLIIVPILTMRVIAEERRQRTDQLLYSLPINMTQVVFGKYLAMLVMLSIPTLIMCIYPIVLKRFGNVNLISSFTSLFGFFLLGAALISIGMFISSVTDNQAIAAGICFLVMLVLYFISDLAGFASNSSAGSLIGLSIIVFLFGIVAFIMTKNFVFGFTVFVALEAVLVGLFLFKREFFEELLPNIMNKLSLFSRFYVFVDGIFDLTGVVYFLSVIAVFMFLSVQSLEKRRWS